MSSKDTTTMAFADHVRQQVEMGIPLSSISAPGINVEAFASGLKITRDDEELTLDFLSGVMTTKDGQKIALASTNARGDMSAFERHTSAAFNFGQRLEDDNDLLTVSHTPHKTLVLFGEDKGNALLLSKFDDGTRGIAVFRSGEDSSPGVLTLGEFKAPGPKRDVEQILDRDMSPLIPGKI